LAAAFPFSFGLPVFYIRFAVDFSTDYQSCISVDFVVFSLFHRGPALRQKSGDYSRSPGILVSYGFQVFQVFRARFRPDVRFMFKFVFFDPYAEFFQQKVLFVVRFVSRGRAFDKMVVCFILMRAPVLCYRAGVYSQ